MMINVPHRRQNGLQEETSQEMENVPPSLSQPHFEGVVRSPLTLPKMGLWSPSGLPKTQSLIAGVKTPHIEAFIIPLERS
jgi:hypothetical protein